MEKIILETDKGPVPVLCTTPVIIVGAEVNGKPNFTTVAWTGVACNNPPGISIALQHHRYSLQGIRQNMVFSVNIPSVDLVKETDYCGTVSGNVADKAKECHFDVFYGKLKTAPFIQQCPVNHACKVTQILNLGSHELIIGSITETHINADCLTRGKPDVKKIKPLMYMSRKYYAVGKNVGEAFNVSPKINPTDKR